MPVVLTSSAPVNDPAVGFARPTTGMGSVRGFGTAVRALGRYYRKTPINVHFSSQVDGKLDAELITIGGPRANRVTATVLKSAVQSVPGLHFDDVNRCITVGGLTIEDYDTAPVSGVPTSDIGMLLMCRSPFSIRQRHSVVCCGFTTYGTFGTAEWFFDEVLADSWRRPLAKQYGIPRWGMRLDRCYVAVVEFQISNGKVIGERVLLSEVFR